MPQANFVLQKPLRAFTPTCEKHFLRVVGFFFFLIKFYKPDFAYQKGAIQRTFCIS